MNEPNEVPASIPPLRSEPQDHTVCLLRAPQTFRSHQRLLVIVHGNLQSHTLRDLLSTSPTKAHTALLTTQAAHRGAARKLVESDWDM